MDQKYDQNMPLIVIQDDLLKLITFMVYMPLEIVSIYTVVLEMMNEVVTCFIL